MKTVKKQFRLISLLFSALIFFQSCRVYHHNSVTLEQAVKEQKRVKIKTKDKKVHKFKRVEYENGAFLGIEKVKGKIVRIPININEIEKVRLHDKTLSIIYGVGVSTVIVFSVIFIIALATWDLNLNLDGLELGY